MNGPSGATTRHRSAVTSACPAVAILAAASDAPPDGDSVLAGAAAALAQHGMAVTLVAIQGGDPPVPIGHPPSSVPSGGGRRAPLRDVRHVLWQPGFGRSSLVRWTLALESRADRSDVPPRRMANIDGILRQSAVIVIASADAIALVPRILRLNPGVRLIYDGTRPLPRTTRRRGLVAMLLKHQAAFEVFLLGDPPSANFAWAYPKIRIAHAAVAGPALVEQVLGIAASPAACKPTSAPALSLIVATRGRTDPLERLLATLRRQDAEAFEVIVVDQNEPGLLDPVLAPYAGQFEIQHLRSRPGLSRARNVGLAASRGRIVGFPDDDCWYPPHRVRDIIRFFDMFHEQDVLLGQTVDAKGRPSVNAVQGASESVTLSNVWFSGNSNTLFMRSAFATELRFDESLGVGAETPFQSGEESDIVLRALSRGARATYCPNLTIHHDQVDSRIGAAQLGRVPERGVAPR